MKKCSSCKKEKSLDNFYKNKTRGDGYRAICKDCAKKKDQEWRKNNRKKHNDGSKRWYHKNHQKSKEINKNNYEKYSRKRRNLVTRIMSENPCSCCGEKRIPCLDFHHLNAEEKENTIAKLRTVNKVLEEVGKCIVLCSNCHRLVHADMLDVPDGLQLIDVQKYRYWLDSEYL